MHVFEMAAESITHKGSSEMVEPVITVQTYQSSAYLAGFRQSCWQACLIAYSVRKNGSSGGSSVHASTLLFAGDLHLSLCCLSGLKLRSICQVTQQWALPKHKVPWSAANAQCPAQHAQHSWSLPAFKRQLHKAGSDTKHGGQHSVHESAEAEAICLCTGVTAGPL